MPGLALAQFYFGSSDAIQAILQEFAPATEGLGQRFGDCASDYTEADEEIATSFNEIESELNCD